MSETYVTVVGNVATQPELKQTPAGVGVARFRLATNERRFDRATDRWTDGPTSFYTVWAWRALGENVCGSVGMGEPVVVQGKLRVVEREDKGQTFLTASIDAVTVGHDLSRGTSAFRRVSRPRTEWTDRSPGSPGGMDAADEPQATRRRSDEPEPDFSGTAPAPATKSSKGSRKPELVPS